MQAIVLVAIQRADCAGQTVADVFGQQNQVFGARGVIAERFQNRGQLADGDLFPQKHLQNLLHLGQLHQVGNKLVDNRRRRLAQLVDQVFGGVAGEYFVGVVADRGGQMSGQNAARLHHRVAVKLGLVARTRIDPNRRRAESRILRPLPGYLAGRHARVDGQKIVRINHARGHRHSRDFDAILRLFQLEAVADADLGKNYSHVRRHPLTNALDTFEQIAAPLGIGQLDQPHAQLDLHGIVCQIIFDPILCRFRRLGLLFGYKCFAGKMRNTIIRGNPERPVQVLRDIIYVIVGKALRRGKVSELENFDAVLAKLIIEPIKPAVRADPGHAVIAF